MPGVPECLVRPPVVTQPRRGRLPAVVPCVSAKFQFQGRYSEAIVTADIEPVRFRVP
jgi:hypothetical protein